MSTDYIRLCPTCGAENEPHVMRCSCGALLAGVDLSIKEAAPPASAAAVATTAAAAKPAGAPQICGYEDCGQSSPAGSLACLYCNRPFTQLTPQETRGLLNLPAALAAHYRVLRPLPVQGAEAELLLVEALTGGPTRVAKIYRSGIQPKAETRERIAKVGLEHRLELLEHGSSDGHTYELMEFCAHGSLRDHMRDGPLEADVLVAILREVSEAVAAVHAAGLLHRDLKPENILIRSMVPLNLVLIDFGISSVLDATQRFTGVARTLPYASPESLSGVIDVKSDYWSLGMLLLEAALGSHPFEGLSEAVILRHLATRNADLSGIADLNFRKLLRGLLLRDPRARWGREEIVRWLDGDPTLADPVELAPEAGFGEPYHLGKEICHSKEQLAVALSRNWRAGNSDLTNGQLLSWFRDVQKDQNVVRLLLDMQHDRKVHPDVQLLNLILTMAPGVPPVWRGENIELPAILARADQALKGDEDSAHWLDQLYQHRVLEAYVKAGNADVGSIVQRWNAACDQFAGAWDAGLALIKAKRPPPAPHEYVNFDDVMYGKIGPGRPAPATMHARLLAIAYDAQWAERLRKRLLAELTSVAVHCPWISGLGDPRTMDAASLLVLESLLPEARKEVERHHRAQERQREEDARECEEVSAEAREIRRQLRKNSRISIFAPETCDLLRADLRRYADLIERVRGSGRLDAAWQETRRNVLLAEKPTSKMMMLVDVFTERQEVNAGWMSLQVLFFSILLMSFLSRFFGTGATMLMVAVIVGVAAWRLVPNFLMMRKIRELAEEL